MTRNLKILGLALVAALALSAVVASAASAAPALFTATVGANEQAEIHGEQVGTDTFTIGALPPLTCGTARETGFPEHTVGGVETHKLGPEAESVTLTPTYETCHVVLLGVTKQVTVTTNSCRYTFSATKNTASTPFSADLHIKCPTGKQIEIHVYDSAAKHAENKPLCTYDIGTQTVLNQVQLTSEGAEIIAHINASVAVHNTIPAPVCEIATNLTATYKGKHTLRARQFVHTTVS